MHNLSEYELTRACMAWLNVDPPDDTSEDDTTYEFDLTGTLHDLAHLLDLGDHPNHVGYLEDLNYRVDMMLRVDAGGATGSSYNRKYGPTYGLRTKVLHRELNAIAIEQHATWLLGCESDTESVEEAVHDGFKDTHGWLLGEYGNDIHLLLEPLRKRPRIQRLGLQMAEFLFSHHQPATTET